jgi:hypothetical protein
MEVEALAGAKGTIERCKPILFIETIKSDKALISEALGGEGYRLLPHGMNTLAVHRDDPTMENIAVQKEAA